MAADLPRRTGPTRCSATPYECLAKKLDADGVPHQTLEVEGMFHVFPFILPWTQESRDVFRRVGEFVRGALEAPGR
jgi:acetyl esterase/lipase